MSATSNKVQGVVCTAWLAQNLGNDHVRVIDASWHMPGTGKKGHDDYLTGHIPGAVFWDIDALSDTAAPLPVTLPLPQQFAEQVGRLGIGSDTLVVVYDGSGIMSAARVWWMLRYFGHDAVAVLDGGIPKWKAESRPLEAGATTPPQYRTFKAEPRPSLYASFKDMMTHVAGSSTQIIDARGAARFRGEEVEARPDTRSGHMPGALNLPFGNLLGADKAMVPAAKLTETFDKIGLAKDKPAVVSCGSGVSGPVVALGLFLAGRPDIAVYDGSWNEWGAHPDAPVVKN